MDLTPIIYSSMVVVFSLLGLVIVVSFACSKMSFCKNKTNRRVKSVEKKYDVEKVLPSISKEQIVPIVKNELFKFATPEVKKETISFSIPEIEETLFEQNVINYSRQTEFMSRGRVENEYANRASRYSVVNSYDRSESFSKMSVQYS